MQASILAKYLCDGGVRLDSSWFDLAERVQDSRATERRDRDQDQDLPSFTRNHSVRLLFAHVLP